MSAPKLKLVPQGGKPVDQATVQELADLLNCALRGDVVGLAYVAIGTGGSYAADFVGRAADNPTQTRGMVCALDDELKAEIHAQADEAPSWRRP